MATDTKPMATDTKPTTAQPTTQPSTTHHHRPTPLQAIKSSTFRTRLRLISFTLTLLSGIFLAVVAPNALNNVYSDDGAASSLVWLTLLADGVLLVCHGGLLLVLAIATFSLVDRRRRFPFHEAEQVQPDEAWVELAGDTQQQQQLGQVPAAAAASAIPRRRKLRIHPALTLTIDLLCFGTAFSLLIIAVLFGQWAFGGDPWHEEGWQTKWAMTPGWVFSFLALVGTFLLTWGSCKEVHRWRKGEKGRKQRMSVEM